MNSVTMRLDFEPFECRECGIHYCLPAGFLAERRRDKRVWYCPNGHMRHYAESEADRLRRERDNLQQQMARVEEERDRAYRERSEEATARQKADRALRRVEKRVHAGVCPCCNRTFSQLARHMRAKHPGTLPALLATG